MQVQLPLARRRYLSALAALAGATLVLSAWQSAAHAADPEAKTPTAADGKFEERNVFVTMSDGVRLSTDLYLPVGTGPSPVLLARTPYGRQRVQSAAQFFASQGYAVVVQDCRGSGDSEGDFYPYFSEGRDGFDAQQWAGAQSWSNGSLGTFGPSYLGGTQWLAAPYGSRYLKAMAPVATFTSWYDNIYYGGALRVHLIGSWSAFMTAPSSDVFESVDLAAALRHLPPHRIDEALGWKIPMLRDSVSHNHYGPYWDPVNVKPKIPDLDLPAFHLVGLYDYFLPETVGNFLLMQRLAKTAHARRNQRLIIGPWDHGTVGQRMVGEVDFGPRAELDMQAILREWFDRHLKGIDNGIDRQPPIEYFVMGHNDWRQAYEWPPRATRFTDYYLNSQGAANSSRGNGALATELPTASAVDEFRSDPNDPVPSKGGRDREPSEEAAWAPYDQSQIEQRQDVLVYTSPPLAEDVEFAGPVKAVVYLETDVRDADLVVKLIDVWPDGFAQVVALGIQRGRFRHSLRESQLLTPGKVEAWEVQMTHTANRFRRGHRIRVDVAGSCFPLYDRNTHSGGGIEDSTTRVAHGKLYHGPDHPSRVVLPLSTGH